MALSPRDRRALIILGTVVVVGGLAFFLLSRGGGAPDQEAAPAPGTPPPSPPSPEVSPSPTVPTAPPVTVFGRDPFVPLVGAVTVDGGTGGAVDGDGVVEPGPGAAGDQDGATTVGDQDVNLLDIFVRNGEEQAQVQVDGETFVVSEGERFAQNFRLVSIDGTCANFQHGDENFTLCEPGENK